MRNGYRALKRLLFPVFLLTTCSSLGAHFLSPPQCPQATSLSPSEELTFHLFRRYLVVVEGTLGDMSKRELLIDTGSSPTIIDQSVAHRLELRVRPARLSQVNSERQATATVLPSLTLGPITAKSLPVLVADLSFAERDLGVRIDAIVGLDVLSARSFSIDYNSRKIIFGQLPIATHSIPFETQPPLITIKANVDGRALRLLVDTGASGLMLFRDHGFDRLPTLDVQNSDNISGTFGREQIEVSDLQFGNFYRRKQAAYIVRSPQSISRDFDGIAGIPALGIKEIAFDFEHRTLSWR
jgi:predicted aspartyl protease